MRLTLAIFTALLALAIFTTHARAQHFRPDHQLHIGAGALTYAGARTVGATPWQSVGACALIGAAKEAYDMTGRGTAEWSDLGHTILPCVIMALIESAVSRREPAPHVSTPRAQPVRMEVARRQAVGFARTLRP